MLPNVPAMETFRIEVSPASLDDLRRRLASARWPFSLPGRGIEEARLRGLADRWPEVARESALNRHPQFIATVDGQRIHFLHVRSARADAPALVLTHGYPSSPAEFLRLIPLLDDFHLVVPSLPGYGWSTPLSGPGWTMMRAARAWVSLMAQLGYDRYGVHGGDVGAGVSGAVASLDPGHVTGVHVVTDPATAAAAATFLPRMAGRLDESDPVDKVILDRMEAFRRDGSGYLAMQNSRPQTIAYGLTDSPLFQLAWIAEKFDEWTRLPFDDDQLLTTASLYWFTGCGASVAHTLYDQAHSSEWGGPVTVPRAFAVFGADETVRKLMPAPAGARWTEFPAGGHFPAMEAPAELAADLRAFFTAQPG
ncbi:epoxide hydrolase family protein [Paractinoplanes rhizophilus]|uniref:Epoxide hydrolase family protein n=1 Tax=Paractinoplanes rhizophilus TaxID=1416877 RepID=A0ABW2HRB3_9ACTN